MFWLLQSDGLLGNWGNPWQGLMCLLPFLCRELEEYMSERVQFVITAQQWDPSFEEASLGAREKTPPHHSIPFY